MAAPASRASSRESVPLPLGACSLSLSEVTSSTSFDLGGPKVVFVLLPLGVSPLFLDPGPPAGTPLPASGFQPPSSSASDAAAGAGLGKHLFLFVGVAWSLPLIS